MQSEDEGQVTPCFERVYFYFLDLSSDEIISLFACIVLYASVIPNSIYIHKY